MTFVFWQNMPTHHQSAWLAALAERSGMTVRVALENGIPDWRRDTGWQFPDYGAASVEVGLTPEKIREIIREAGRDAVHTFSGLGAYPGVHEAFRECVRQGLKTGLMIECGDPRGLRGFVATQAWRMRRVRFGRHVHFLLGIGEGAPVRFFRRMGFHPDRIFEFAYFPPEPRPSETTGPNEWPGEGVRLLYIGQLIHRKGVDRLLEALAEVREKTWSLRIIGTGTMGRELRETAESLRVSDRVRFEGTLPNTDAMTVLSQADLLILPSRYDGWGAVVNEALCRGVPVICSDLCGARQVVGTNPILGTVFAAPSELRPALALAISGGRLTERRSRAIRQLAACLAPSAGADYFLDIISHVYSGARRPVAPWRGLQSAVTQELRRDASGH